ncbi:MAG: ABC-type transport system involved in cytochrome bd biosynthesis fused ATPase/permease subunit, partial [Planctomycetota bacterium]
LTTVQSADQILVLTAEGEVETVGSHDELLARPGWYADTWEQQQRTESLAQSIERAVSEAANAPAGGER